MVTVRIREVLRARGVPEPAASLAAETGITVFHLAFQQWIAPGETRSMAALTHEHLSASTELVHPGH